MKKQETDPAPPAQSKASHTKPATIRYFAWARHPTGRVAQLLVVRVTGQRSKQEWTGVFYPSDKDAAEHVGRLNCAGRS